MLYLVYFILYFFIFIFGSCIGSFLNVVIYRVPNKISIAKGRSFCPNCKTQIKSYDLIPIISFFILKRKCRSCKQEISFRYPLIEAFAGIIAVLIFINFYFTAKAILAFAFCAVLISISLIDFDTKKIPNSLIIALIPLSVLAFFVFKDISVAERIIGVFAVSLPMLLVKVFVPKSIGAGEIKLMAVCGMFLGWKLILLSTFFGIIIEGIYVIIKMLLKKLNKSDTISFAPALCIGIFISLMYGNKIIDFCLNILK